MFLRECQGTTLGVGVLSNDPAGTKLSPLPPGHAPESVQPSIRGRKAAQRRMQKLKENRAFQYGAAKKAGTVPKGRKGSFPRIPRERANASARIGVCIQVDPLAQPLSGYIYTGY